MKIDGRLFIVLIMALALVPGACATSITASDGTSVSVSNGGSVQGNTIVDNNGASGMSMISGNLLNLKDNTLLDLADGSHVAVSACGNQLGMDPSIVNSDTKGNYATAYYDYTPKSKLTSFSYNWNKYTPTDSTGSGVGVLLSLTAMNAYSVDCGLSSGNKEGDHAQVDTYVGLSNPNPTSSLSNYYTYAYGCTDLVGAYQSANYAASTYPITIDGFSSNSGKGLAANANMVVSTGAIYSPTVNTYASTTSDYVYPTATQLYTAGTGSITASASNPGGNSVNFNLKVTGTPITGIIQNPNFYAWSQPTSSEAKLVSLTSATGSTAAIKGSSNNHESDSANADILATAGTKINYPTMDVIATQTSDISILELQV